MEVAGGADVRRGGSLLGITEVAGAQEHLLPRFEGWHPEVGAAGTAESVAQVALSREEPITQGSWVSVRPRNTGKRGTPRFVTWPRWPDGNGWVHMWVQPKPKYEEVLRALVL